MDYSYFPGCTLKNKAKDLDIYARSAAQKLGFNLIEIEDWQCCGAVYPLARDEIATRLAAVRSLAKARDAGWPLVTLCSACYNVLKQTNYDIQNDENFRLKVNNYLKEDDIEYNGETKVLHYLEVLRDEVGWGKVKELAANSPYKNKKIGAYYGCLLLRPSKILQFDDAENPTIIEDFIKAIGATPVIYAQRNECCGAYNMFAQKLPSCDSKMQNCDKASMGEGGGCPDESCESGSCEQNALAKSSTTDTTIDTTTMRVRKIVSNAASMGAQTLVTSCPLCKYNLEKNICEKCGLDVMYFSQMLATAIGA